MEGARALPDQVAERPTFATIDEWMQAGYREQARGHGLPIDRLGEIPARAREVLAAESGEVRRTKVGRNELCPCGSGRKFKKCCGR